MPNRTRHAAALGWFALVAACVFWKVAFIQQVLYWGDIMLYFLPMTTFAHRWLAQGVLPLWNPHTLFGQPFVGNPQEWLFYPSTILLPFLHPARYLSWDAVLHLWLGGVGMWLFLHALGLSFRPALFGSTAWMLCGAFVPRAQFPGMFQSIALIGWLMWAVERVLQASGAVRIAMLAVSVALLLLAGHAQVAYMALLPGTAWAGWRMARSGWRPLPSLLAGAAGGLLLSAVHWLPMLQLLHETPRINLSVWGVNRFPLRLEQIPLLLVPDLYGTPWQGNWLGRGNYWEVAYAVGILPLTAAIVAWRARSEARFWLIIAFLSWWLALGTSGGLYILAYYLLPGLKAFHDPARWLILTDFAVCVAASMGWEHLRFSRKWLLLPLVLVVLALLWASQGANIIEWAAYHDVIRASRSETVSSSLVTSARTTAVIGCLRAIAVAVFALLILRLSPSRRWWAAMALLLFDLLPQAMPANPTTNMATFAQPPDTVQTVARTRGRLFVPEQVPMWRKYVSYVDYGANTPEYLRRWQQMLGSNIGMMWGLSEASGYEPVAVQRAVRHYVYLAQEWKRFQRDSHLLRKLQQTGVGAVATGKTVDSWRVLPLPHQPMRAWTAESSEPLIVHDPSPQRAEIVNTPAGELVLADTAYPGWHVWVNGKPQPWRTHDGVFRAVTVTNASSTVLWRYEPDAFRIGFYLSLIGCGVTSGALIFGLLAGKPYNIAK
ncbi:MAG: hypothetical protein KatS3mg022_1581 [Armatimonadota bacterium]|nr:MAG: hypothetical protein KatS3mg022_1581 [Armatimonadota bacterium]